MFPIRISSRSAPRSPSTVRRAGAFQECCWGSECWHRAIHCSAERSSPLAIAPSALKRHPASRGEGSRLAAAMRSSAAKKAVLFRELNCVAQDMVPTDHATPTRVVSIYQRLPSAGDVNGITDRRRVQTIVSLPHSRKSHFSAWQVMPSTAKIGSGRSSISSSLSWPQHSQVGQSSWADSLAATACNSPRTFIVVAPSGCLERITAEQASGVAASVKMVMCDQPFPRFLRASPSYSARRSARLFSWVKCPANGCLWCSLKTRCADVAASLKFRSRKWSIAALKNKRSQLPKAMRPTSSALKASCKPRRACARQKS
jgi:hypothetical protein